MEAWIWEHFTTQDKADDWMQALGRPPALAFGVPGVEDFDLYGCALRAAVTVGEALIADPAGQPADDAPPGWSNADLLAESRALGVVIE